MAEEHKIIVGDVVQPKSGGSQMVVTGFDGSDAACQWMDGNKKFTERFPLIMLVWIDPNRSIL